MDKQAVKHLIVDSGAFIKNAAIKDIGENIYTIHDVVNEIRDQNTRDKLQVLPYDLKFREPTQESVNIVTEFARKTGDLRVLSSTDIRLIALAYTLEKEYVGVEHIRTEPTKKIQYVMPGLGETFEGGKPLPPGFYMKKKTSSDDNDDANSRNEDALVHQADLQDNPEEDDDDDEGWIIPKKTVPVKKQPSAATVEYWPKEVVQDATNDPETSNKEYHDADANRLPESDSKDDAQTKDNEDDDDSYYSDEDDEGWITPGNIEAVKQAASAMNQLELSSLSVACLTTDYAMQNVLIQMGLHVVSVDGMLIRRTQTKVLRCYGCFKVMSDCQRQFCSHCGNKTLSRVTVAYNDDGTIQYFFSRYKKFSKRGLRFSLPRPQGGKHANNPVLCEDQRQAHKRPSKLGKKKVDVFDIDFVPNSSPFATTDIYTRAAMHGYMGRSREGSYRRNPNENHKLYGHKK